ncbi:MAG: efflux RND transporter periplasmic adaptor subunit [Chloroflexi bacterium OHK40]
MSVTTSPPERRVLGGRLRGARRRQFSPWLLAPTLLIAAGAALLIWRLATTAATAPTASSTAQARLGSLAVTVSGSGSVEAARQLNLAFAVDGTVAEVLVAAGDVVAAGQPLARLDTADLELALQQAEADLRSAEARVAAANGQGASELDLAAARSQLAAAEASLRQTLEGNVTASDIAAAEANLRLAEASLAELRAGPSAESLASARAQVEQARLALESQRTNLSAAKLRAEQDLTQAANSLRDAQDNYSSIYWQNREREKAPGGLPTEQLNAETAALRAVQNAEAALASAQLAYEQAQTDERIGVQQAEASLAEAEEQLRILLEGPTATELASAEAQVEQARANLESLRSGASEAERTQAQAQVEQARISLEQLTSPAAPTEIASAEAALAQAQLAYATAERNLQQATLTAPFAGTIAAISLVEGASASASEPVVLMDLSSLYIELNLSETDVGQVAVGQPVTLTFDALSDLSLTGEVAQIAPVATVEQNVVTYPVRVRFSTDDPRVKVGMTATGTITVEERDQAILVPTRAIQTVNGVATVQVQQAEGQPAVTVRVETGLSNGAQTEILSCVDTGTLCLEPGDQLLISTTASSTTTTEGPPGGFAPGARPDDIPFGR